MAKLSLDLYKNQCYFSYSYYFWGWTLWWTLESLEAAAEGQLLRINQKWEFIGNDGNERSLVIKHILKNPLPSSYGLSLYGRSRQFENCTFYHSFSTNRPCSWHIPSLSSRSWTSSWTGPFIKPLTSSPAPFLPSLPIPTSIPPLPSANGSELQWSVQRIGLYKRFSTLGRQVYAKGRVVAKLRRHLAAKGLVHHVFLGEQCFLINIKLYRHIYKACK